MVAVNIPFTIPTIRPLDAFLLSLFAIVIAKAIRPIIAHRIIVDEVNANKSWLCSLQIPPVILDPLAISLLVYVHHRKRIAFDWW